jgi:Tfp pilus assembly protein PilX
MLQSTIHPRHVLRRAPRHAAALLIVIVCLGVATVLFLAMMKVILVQKRVLDAKWRQAQAARLADSAIERAAARLAADPAYQGETWNLSADDLTQPDSAVVTIHVEPIASQPERRLVRVQADYPDHPHLRARQEREATISNPRTQP